MYYLAATARAVFLALVIVIVLITSIIACLVVGFAAFVIYLIAISIHLLRQK